MTQPEFSYVRLKGGKATVTCACGWGDPHGPMPVGQFDPAEALAAAAAQHPRCLKILPAYLSVVAQIPPGERRFYTQDVDGTRQVFSMDANGTITQLIERDPGVSPLGAEATPSVDPRRITEQTTLGELAVQRVMLGVSALTLMRDLNGQLTAVVQSTSGLHIGQGATEAAAIDTAFVSLRLAMLPAPLKASIASSGPMVSGCPICGRCEDHIHGGDHVDDVTITHAQDQTRAPRQKTILMSDACPRCQSVETRPVRRFGFPVVGEADKTTEWQCLDCQRRFDGPLVRR